MKTSHTIRILKSLLQGDVVIASDLMASNSNQYFGKIKENGIALIEVWMPNATNSGRHKERSLLLRAENIDRARQYLTNLQKGKK